MRQFFVQLCIFLGWFTISCYGVLCLADGYTDEYYIKLTSATQNSLIIGSSRAAQGLDPDIINETFSTDIYNYAFSRVHSPYGEPYLMSIKKKIKRNSKEGLFILEVNPWSISDLKKYSTNFSYFREQESFLGQISSVTSKPNLEYLLFHYNKRKVELLTNRFKKFRNKDYYVTDAGWLRVRLNEDFTQSNSRKQATVKSYQDIKNMYSGLSQIRLEYLKRTINYLKSRGKVYVLRLPVSEEMLKIEDSLLPKFDQLMDEVSSETSTPYFNFMSLRDTISFTDGHHMDSISTIYITKKIINKMTK